MPITTGTPYQYQLSGLQLGETDTTAHRGDHGVIAYEHAQIRDANPHETNIDQILVTAAQWTAFENTLNS